MSHPEPDSARARVRELLELLGALDAQRRYEREVPIADVAAELVSLWFDDLYHPGTSWFSGTFSDRELAALAAGLFNPLRRRIQSRVDRRFNRARDDARREVAEFAERLRTEMKLDDLADGVLDVVGKTVQPTKASVWVRLRENT